MGKESRAAKARGSRLASASVPGPSISQTGRDLLTS